MFAGVLKNANHVLPVYHAHVQDVIKTTRICERGIEPPLFTRLQFSHLSIRRGDTIAMKAHIGETIVYWGQTVGEWIVQGICVCAWATVTKEEGTGRQGRCDG